MPSVFCASERSPPARWPRWAALVVLALGLAPTAGCSAFLPVADGEDDGLMAQSADGGELRAPSVDGGDTAQWPDGYGGPAIHSGLEPSPEASEGGGEWNPGAPAWGEVVDGWPEDVPFAEPVAWPDPESLAPDAGAQEAVDEDAGETDESPDNDGGPGEVSSQDDADAGAESPDDGGGPSGETAADDAGATGEDQDDAGVPGELSNADAGTDVTGGPADGGSQAGGYAPDAGPAEAPDAGTAEVPDAGPVEATDAGTAETTDAGTAETPDAGTAEAPDAGPPPDPCLDGPTTCAPDAACIPIDDTSYACECPAGTVGDGTECLPFITVGDYPVALALADFTGDGTDDLAVLNRGVRTVHGLVSSVRILRGDGEGGFAAAGIYGVASDSRDLFVGHLDSDGDLDLVAVSHEAQQVVALTNLGGGTFTSTTYALGQSGVLQCTGGDIDGDGWMDVSCVHDAGAINVRRVLRGGGFGGLNAAATVETWGHDVGGIAAGDFSGDGWGDYAVSMPGAVGDPIAVTEWLMGTRSVGAPPDPGALFARDLDADGRADLFAVQGGASPTLTLRLSTESGDFAPAVSVAEPDGDVDWLEVMDVDGDGRRDVVWRDTAVRYVLDVEGVGFVGPKTVPYPGATSMVARDLDGNNAPDWVVTLGDDDAVVVLLR